MKNYVGPGKDIPLNVGTGKKAGDPVQVGGIIGVCKTDADANGVATVVTEGRFYLTVQASDGTNNVAISQGDPIYLQADGTLNVNTAGELFGYALEPVAPGATATIEVKLAAK